MLKELFFVGMLIFIFISYTTYIAQFLAAISYYNNILSEIKWLLIRKELLVTFTGRWSKHIADAANQKIT